MGKTAIVTGGTCKDVSAMGVLALNLKNITPDIADELIIFHDGISKRNQNIITKIFPTRFIKFKFKINFKDNRTNRSLRYFSPMIFCKYECFNLLKEYERVMWTDYDIIIRKNLMELLESQSGLQIIEDKGPLRKMFLDDAQCISDDGYDINQTAITTPLMVFTRQIGDYGKYYEWCKAATVEYAAYIDLPEQCIISMLIQKFHIQYEKLSNSKYALHPRADDGNSSILHAYGRPKFWEGLQNKQWQEYYQEWLCLGGSPYRKPLKEKIIEIKEKIIRK